MTAPSLTISIKKNPAMLHGKGNITREEAAQIASKFSGIAANNLQEDSDEDGNMAPTAFFMTR